MGFTDEPRDNVPITELPEAIRETRAALQSNLVNAVGFEVGTITGNAVYWDDVDNIWRRSSAGVAGRKRIHGIAFIESAQVQVFGLVNGPWLFAASDIYVSDDPAQLGLLIETPTDLPAGYSMSASTLLLNAQISLTFDNLVAEIEAARGASVDVGARLDGMQSEIDSAEGDITLLDGTLDSHIADPTAHAAVSAPTPSRIVVRDAAGRAQVAAPAVAADIARKAEVDLVASDLATTISEVETARGSFLSLDGRIGSIVDADGNPLISVTTSTFAAEPSSVAYVDLTTFTVAGDASLKYINNRPVRFNSSVIAFVTSSSYSSGTGLTTVIVFGNVIPTPMTLVEFGMPSEYMPKQAHSWLTNILTADETSSDTTKNKHVSNNQLKVLHEADATLAGVDTALGNRINVEHDAATSEHLETALLSLGVQRKNFIINGNFVVNQSGAMSLDTSYTYKACDLFISRAAVTGGICKQFANSRFKSGYCLKWQDLTNTSTTNVFYLRHYIEAKNAARLAGNKSSAQITVWHDYESDVTYTLSVYYLDSVDDSASVTLIDNISVDVPTSTVTTIKLENVSMPANAAKGILVQVRLTGIIATTKNFLWGDFQLELGEVCTEPEYVSVTDTLLNVMRYYEVGYSLLEAGMNTTRYVRNYCNFLVPKRVVPSLIYSDGSGNLSKITELRNTAATHNVSPASAVTASALIVRSAHRNTVSAIDGFYFNFAADARI